LLTSVIIKIPEHELLHIQTFHFLHKLLAQYFFKIKVMTLVGVHIALSILLVLLSRHLQIFLLNFMYIVLSLK
jgi:hypothetical protein